VATEPEGRVDAAAEDDRRPDRESDDGGLRLVGDGGERSREQDDGGHRERAHHGVQTAAEFGTRRRNVLPAIGENLVVPARPRTVTGSHGGAP
jgi:hypothetical protein